MVTVETGINNGIPGENIKHMNITLIIYDVLLGISNSGPNYNMFKSICVNINGAIHFLLNHSIQGFNTIASCPIILFNIIVNSNAVPTPVYHLILISAYIKSLLPKNVNTIESFAPILVPKYLSNSLKCYSILELRNIGKIAVFRNNAININTN